MSPENTAIQIGTPEYRSPLREVAESLLGRTGIELDGSRGWDLRVHDERFFERVLREGTLALGETYTEGMWDSPHLDQCLTHLIEHQNDISPQVWRQRFLILKSKLFNMQNFVLCRRVAEQHYDLDNKLYARMLDPWMQYTCAYYARATDLNQAQEDKLDQICKKLQLTSSDSVLELGCGFGGFAKFAAERYGCSVVGYNISKEQIAWGREWTKGLPVEIREADFRKAQGSYTKVVSVGLCEHVGYKNYRTLMKTAHRCLKPGGLFLLHCIGGNVSAVTTEAWLEKYIFPGSVMPSAQQLARAFEGLFVLEDWHNFGLDYDKTCMAWFENFDRNWSEIREFGYDEQFYRKWKYYLMLCAASFRTRKNQNWEVVLSKGGHVGGYTSVR